MRVDYSKEIDHKIDLIIPVVQGEFDPNQLSKTLNAPVPDFFGEFKEYKTLYLNNGRKVFLLGIGNSQDRKNLREAFRLLIFQNRKELPSHLAVDGNSLTKEELSHVVMGVQLALYEMGQYKTGTDNPREEGTLNLILTHVDQKEVSGGGEEGLIAGEVINRIRGLVDAPANIKTPEYLAQWAKDSAKSYGYDCQVFDKQELTDKGFGAILAVGQGSIHPPVLINTTYNPTKSKDPALVLVGKGITFDTGGLSIKPSQNLHYMKSDMGGAAAVLGTVELIARLQLPIHVVGLVASAENAVDAHSFKPGDVINSYSGKSIEIIDTDAEGRLVLADALSYATTSYNATTIIDFATLTGSVVRALGYGAAGLFTTNDAFAVDLSNTGEQIKERVWRLPMYKEFEEDLHSDIADIRNFSNQPIAGAITAAKFLEVFTNDHPRWAHLDIAGTAFGDSPYSKMKSATGFGVILMLNYIKSLIKR